jgi:hypothetical protein
MDTTVNLPGSGCTAFATDNAGDKGETAICQKRVAVMSDSLQTTIARLSERLDALKERL